MADAGWSSLTPTEKTARAHHMLQGRWGSRSVEDRFWSKVDRSAGKNACWPWTGARLPYGYGVFNPDGKTCHSNRFAWELEHGPIPAGMVVCHACDHTFCCNTSHMFIGTQADNLRDCKAKDRHARGERNGRVKLTDADVLEIRRLRAAGETCASIAEEFGTSHGHINRITLGVAWKHLGGDLHLRDYHHRDIHAQGERNVNAKLTCVAVVEIRRRLADETHTSIARDYGVSRHTISQVASGRTWKHVE